MAWFAPGTYSVKKSWKLSDLNEYHTAPPYATVESTRNATIFRNRKKRRFGFGGGVELGGEGMGGGDQAAGRGAAFVGEIGDVWTLGTIGCGSGAGWTEPGVRGDLGSSFARRSDV